MVRYFWVPHIPQSLPTISHTLPHSFSWPAISLPLICFLFFSFHLNTHTLLSLTHSHQCHSIPPSPSYFSGKIIGKSLGTSKHLRPFYLTLVDLYDKWIYSFYNGSYLSCEDLGVLAF